MSAHLSVHMSIRMSACKAIRMSIHAHVQIELEEETTELHERVVSNLRKFETTLAANGHKLLNELLDTVRPLVKMSEEELVDAVNTE